MGRPRLGREIAPLRRLEATYGTYFVTGNHEYYSEADRWIAEIEKLGVRTLRNEAVPIGSGDDVFYLAGVDDYSAHRLLPGHRQDIPKALEGIPEDRAVVLLAHQPRAVWEAAKHDIDLVLVCFGSHSGIRGYRRLGHRHLQARRCLRRSPGTIGRRRLGMTATPDNREREKQGNSGWGGHHEDTAGIIDLNRRLRRDRSNVLLYTQAVISRYHASSGSTHPPNQRKHQPWGRRYQRCL